MVSFFLSPAQLGEMQEEKSKSFPSLELLVPTHLSRGFPEPAVPHVGRQKGMTCASICCLPVVLLRWPLN